MVGDAERHDEVRLAILGTGAIAQIVHLPVLSQMAGVRVTGVCDLDREKAVAIGTRFGIPTVCREDAEIFDAPDVDGVIICSPSYLHEEQAIAALEGGKHVLVEKPMALTAEGTQRVIETAERVGRSVMVAMNNRYRPDSQAVRTFVTGGELGDVFLVKGGLYNRKVRVLRPTWRHRLATSGGGALMDLGVQILDLCMWMLDYPAIVRLVCQTHPGEGMEVEDSAALLMETATGASISIEATWSLLAGRDRQYAQVLATRGSASLSPLSVYKDMEHGLLDVTPQLPPVGRNLYTATYSDQLAHFAAVIAGTASAPMPREQIRLMTLISAAYQSARTGEAVSLT